MRPWVRLVKGCIAQFLLTAKMNGELSAFAKQTIERVSIMQIKTKSGRVLILPSPEEDAQITAAALSDPDNLPLTDSELRQFKRGRGRPQGSGTKEQVTLRLDTQILERFRATGNGWQTRINDALRDWAKHH